MAHLQGSLQAVFDALYELGVIEPVLETDWRSGLSEIAAGSPHLDHAVNIVNSFGTNQTATIHELKRELGQLSRHTLEILAMEVAREFADFHSRSGQSLQ